MSGTIRVAISGGGLAGASLFHALLPHKHLDVHIFESAAEFKEQGAAIGVTRNALKALKLIGPSATGALERAGAVPQLGVRFMLAQGESAGSQVDEALDEMDGEGLTSIVHRAAFLKELLADVPVDKMHALKKLARIDRDADGASPITLHFQDESTHGCDVLIGADGIHSIVRGAVLGESDPATQPKNEGWWAVMALVPYAQARAALGEQNINAEEAREHMWIGKDTYMLHNVLNNGQLAQFVLSGYEPSSVGSDQWHRMITADELRTAYKDWPAHLLKGVEELLCDKPAQPAIYLWDHLPAKTYASGTVAVMGDAAHATTPWQGSGAGMSIEDSLILSSLLGKAKNAGEAVTALRIYDEVRRPRTQQIVESSRGTGLIVSGRGEETGLDLKKLKEKLLPRWGFIITFDVEKHRDDAVALFDAANK